MQLSFTLLKAITEDGLALQGMLHRPKRSRGKALIFVHGLGSTFYAGQTRLEELAKACDKQGVAVASFNTRGHDIVASLSKKEGTQTSRVLGGYAVERFEQCVPDIAAFVATMRREGYKDIFLTGHSTGANKVVYYLYKKQDRRVKGAVLLSPLSDVTKLTRERDFRKIYRQVKQFAKSHKGDFLPSWYPYVLTARRFLSLYTPGSPEDVFPYHNPKARWKELKSIKKSLLAVFGGADEYLDRPVREVLEAFRQQTASRSFSGLVIPAAGHGFQGHERMLALRLSSWVARLAA